MKLDIEIDLTKFALVFHWAFSPIKVYDGEYDFNYHRIPTKNVYDDSGSDGEWFVFFHEDCMDPVKYLVRATSWSAAYDAFIEEFADVVSEEDLKDYDIENDSHLQYSGRGWVDTENIMGFAAKLVRIEEVKS